MAPKLALTLENNGSVARDHLASERTYLAYIRTSLALASTGVALVQLLTLASSSESTVSSALHTYARPLGAATIGAGLLILAIGTIRFFSIQNKLTEGLFPVARVFTLSTTLCISTLIVVVFALLVSDRQDSPR